MVEKIGTGQRFVFLAGFEGLCPWSVHRNGCGKCFGRRSRYGGERRENWKVKWEEGEEWGGG